MKGRNLICRTQYKVALHNMKLQNALSFSGTQYKVILRIVNYNTQYQMIRCNIVLEDAESVYIVQYEIIWQ